MLAAALDLNGTELEAMALSISQGGALIVAGVDFDVAKNQAIRVRLLTDAGSIEIDAHLLGARDPRLARRAPRRYAHFGFAIQFDPLDAMIASVFESILDGVRLDAINVSMRISGIASLQGNPIIKGNIVPGTDRRIVPRMDVKLPVLVRSDSGPLDVPESTLTNLSATGACLEISAERKAFGDRMMLHIALPPVLQQKIPGQEQDTASLTAETVWTEAVKVAGEDTQVSTPRFRIGVRLLFRERNSQPRIARLVGQLLIAAERFDLQVGGMITTEAVECRNELDQRIVGYLDRPKHALPGSPVAIIVPGYGESKQAYVALGYYLADNGFHVLRYDHCDHIGESDGDPIKTTLTGFKRDLQAVLAFVKDTRPDSPIAVIANGLAGRVALKTAAADRRMDLLVILTGIVDLQLACLSLHQEDLIVTFLRGARRGVSNLLGMRIDADHFLQDAIKEGYADLRTTLRDAQQIRGPVMFFATHEEPGGSVSAVNEVRAVIARQALSQVFPIPQTLQQLHENPRKEWAMFRQLVSCCMTHLSPTAATREMIEPAQLEIGRQNRLERQRAKTHRPIEKSGSKEFWHAYLDHFHCLANIPEYWHLLDQISRLLGPMEKGATILDAGCGPGNLGMCMLLKDFYRRRGSSGAGFDGLRYVGIEVDQSVLARAAVSFSNVGNDALVMGGDREDSPEMGTSLTCADLNRPLPFRDHQFSRVVCNLVLGYLEDPMSSLLELVRVLAPGGLIIVTSLKPYADLIEIYKNFMLRTDLPEEIEEAERLLNTACKIKQAESDGLFRSFQPDEIAMLMIMSGVSEPQVSSTFGNQAYIVAAKKPRHDEYDEGVPEYLTQESTFATSMPAAGIP